LEVYYGHFPVKFFLVGFAGDGEKLFHVGFYRNLREFERRMKKLYGSPKPRREKFSDFVLTLSKYFSGKEIAFEYPIKIAGTRFQLNVWKKVSEIPYGETRSYRWVAESIGNPRAARPAANALKRNPLALIVPCHRVIRSDGKIAGSGFGRDVREYLLRLEGAIR